jgi:DNA polymerase III delta subunit
MPEPQLRLFMGDSYLCDRALAARDRALREKHPQMERIVLFADEMDIAALDVELRACSLFSNDRHFILRRVEAVRAGPALASALQRPIPDGTYVSLWAGSLRATHPVAKLLGNSPEARVSLPTPKGQALQRVAREMIEASGLALPSRVSRILTAACGNDLWSLHQELEKLRTLGLGEVVSETEARRLCFNHAETTIFPLYDRLGEGQLAAALQELEGLREDAGRIVSGILRHFTRLVMVRLLIEHRLPPSEIASKMGMQAWLCRRLIEQAREQSLNALARTMHAGVIYDQRIKQGQIAPADALMQLILTATTATAGS